MTFQETLNEYIVILHCSGRELAECSGLSPAMISRCRAGARTLAFGSPQLEKLATGLAALAGQRGEAAMTKDTVLAAFFAAAQEEQTAAQEGLSDAQRSRFPVQTGSPVDADRMKDNFNALIAALGLNLNELARYLNYDASYISRIRSGQRRPAEPAAFADGVCRFVVRRRTKAADKAALAALIGAAAADIAEEGACFSALRNWLCSNTAKEPDRLGSFLTKLDDFDLNEFIRSIRFDDLKVPSVPFQLPTARSYYGLEQMKEGELDFFKATVLSRSAEPVFLCSDMEMEDLAEDLEFGKKWMFAIAMALKKGLRFHIIHNIDRPFAEMMLGLESWIPMYMTGQLSPYYLRTAGSSAYGHLHYVSGAAALTGECITGFHSQGRYYLTKTHEEVAYYRRMADCLLKKAHPLMEIYRADSENAYRSFLLADAKTEGPRGGILSVPPLYTMPEVLLLSILDRAGLPAEDAAGLREYAALQRDMAEVILAASPIHDDIPCISEEEFAAYPVSLPVEGAFFDEDLFYTYEEYLAHLRAVEAYAQTHANYTAKLNTRQAFRHIQIFLHYGKWAMISKSRSPSIHFVIRQPRLREALENMIIPVSE